MEKSSQPNYFLDTSVARSLLLGTKAYKQYFKSQFNRSDLFVSNYVRMELIRSYLINIISFYFVLRLESINTIADALAFWSNKFKTSELKAVIQLIPQIFSTHQLNFNSAKDKEKALQVLGTYIKRFEIILRRKYQNTGYDSTKCARALVTLNNKKLSNMPDSLKQFVDEFGDVEKCRTQCHIDQFFLSQYRGEVEAYVRQASQLPKNIETRGFLRIADSLKEIIEQGESACSCRRCEQIGDAVIALDAPRNLRLEHSDRSFDYLCPPINQPHYKHPSENQVVTNNL